MERLEVIASFDWLEQEETIGYLEYDSLKGRDVFSFEFTRQWIKSHPDIILGADLQPFTGKQYAEPGRGIFGCFADCLPDFWGRLLMDLKAKQSASRMVKLSDWDYLKGIEDTLRVGGFRFKNPDTGHYLNYSENYQVPPIISIDELVEAARKIEEEEFSQNGPDNRWIERLLKPGTSVGGARPKACVTDGKDLYIAKFPSTVDRWNEGRWEFFANKLAELCGIQTTESRLIPSENGHDIFLSKRFDRTADGKRVHMASALNMLGLTLEEAQKDLHSYHEIADFMALNGTHVEQSIQELYRRIAFNICIGNADDHLKNHSFILTKKGWELSPVYDINPSIFETHSLLIDGISNKSSLGNLYKAHQLYRLDKDTAYGIIKEVTRNMKNWKSIASDCSISDGEMELFSQRFEVGMSL